MRGEAVRGGVSVFLAKAGTHRLDRLRTRKRDSIFLVSTTLVGEGGYYRVNS